jgi:transposase
MIHRNYAECIISRTYVSEETCSVCRSELKIIGKKLVRTEVEYIPAKLKVKQIVQQVAKCTKCGTGESENPKDHFQKAAVPNPVLPHLLRTFSRGTCHVPEVRNGNSI